MPCSSSSIERSGTTARYRTQDLRVNSALLYRLSYRGVVARLCTWSSLSGGLRIAFGDAAPRPDSAGAFDGRAARAICLLKDRRSYCHVDIHQDSNLDPFLPNLDQRCGVEPPLHQRPGFDSRSATHCQSPALGRASTLPTPLPVSTFAVGPLVLQPRERRRSYRPAFAGNTPRDPFHVSAPCLACPSTPTLM